MTDNAVVTMRLECKHCAHHWPDDSVVEAMLLHFQVEHDTDNVELDLVAVCKCGATMTFTGEGELGGGRKRTRFHCNACGSDGWVNRSSGD